MGQPQPAPVQRVTVPRASTRLATQSRMRLVQSQLARRKFFSKWNFFDPADTGNGNVPQLQSNSTPQDLNSPGPGAETHSFMLDAIAATGAVILPYSYQGASLSSSGPTFRFNGYSACNSTPFPPGDIGTNCNPLSGATISSDAETLAAEIASIRSVWKNVPVVVMGHSQGGLIAFSAWQAGELPTGTKVFSLDSPINGVCPLRAPPLPVIPIFLWGSCLGVASYPTYDDRLFHDPTYLAQDLANGIPFAAIGTEGDTVSVPVKVFGLDLGNLPAYGVGNETLQHQLLVTGSELLVGEQCRLSGPATAWSTKWAISRPGSR